VKIALLFHVFGVTVWVGGMFFAYLALRPAAATLDPPHRLPLWQGTLRRFFNWVWAAVALIFASGIWMVLLLGGLTAAPSHVRAMIAVGVVMTGIFIYVFFVPFKRLIAAVEAGNWKEGGSALGGIRKLVAVNLTLGLITIAIATAGSLVRV